MTIASYTPAQRTGKAIEEAAAIYGVPATDITTVQARGADSFSPLYAAKRYVACYLHHYLGLRPLFIAETINAMTQTINGWLDEERENQKLFNPENIAV